MRSTLRLGSWLAMARDGSARQVLWLVFQGCGGRLAGFPQELGGATMDGNTTTFCILDTMHVCKKRGHGGRGGRRGPCKARTRPTYTVERRHWRPRAVRRPVLAKVDRRGERGRKVPRRPEEAKGRRGSHRRPRQRQLWRRLGFFGTFWPQASGPTSPFGPLSEMLSLVGLNRLAWALEYVHLQLR